MGSRLSGFGQALYDSKRRQFLGRDGAGWAKLGIFYFFFYLGLAGFFCAMLAVFMAVSPRDRPRYYLEASRMRTRSNPLSPGLGFRPQPIAEKNLILIDKDVKNYENDTFVKSLDQYLKVYYWKKDNYTDVETKKFSISNPGDCTPQGQFGFPRGNPCVLVKMNKIVDFEPEPGQQEEDTEAFQASRCQQPSNATLVYCYGEYPADAENLGQIIYYSENGASYQCGSLDKSWFPYRGKNNRRDVYQAPYVWVQFNRLKPNVLVHVICRVFAKNINFDRKASRGLTRFQLFIKDDPKQ